MPTAIVAECMCRTGCACVRVYQPVHCTIYMVMVEFHQYWVKEKHSDNALHAFVAWMWKNVHTKRVTGRGLQMWNCKYFSHFIIIFHFFLGFPPQTVYTHVCIVYTQPEDTQDTWYWRLCDNKTTTISTSKLSNRSDVMTIWHAAMACNVFFFYRSALFISFHLLFFYVFSSLFAGPYQRNLANITSISSSPTNRPTQTNKSTNESETLQ